MSADVMTVADLRAWLLREVADRTGFDEAEIEADRPLDEYGLSSRDAVQLSGDLEDLLDRTLPSTLLYDHPTVAQLAEALLGAPAPAPERREAPVAGDAVAVVGLGCRLPGGIDGPAAYWDLLAAGGDAVGERPAHRWAAYGSDDDETLRALPRAGGFLDDIAGFDAEFFGISPREAARIDPQQRMLLEVSWEALEHAGIAPASLRGTATGVFVGISGNEYGQLALADVAEVDAWTGTGAAMSIAANRLSYALDLRGPSVAVDTACSSSLVAVHLALQSLRSGESDVAIAAGANLLLGPGITANFAQMGVISPGGACKPFSSDADGIVRAEGAGVVVLKRLADAVADGDRVLAVLRGSAVNQDGRSNGLTAPNPQAQQALLRDAYGAAGIDPAEVDYVEAHGTGTLLGDPIEAGALGAVLGAGRPEDRPLLIGSAKSNLGHLEAAAGIAGLIKLVLALAHRAIPATLHHAAGNPHIDFEALRLAVADRLLDWPAADRPARAGVSGFGFGGTNAHVIVEEAPAAPGEDGGAEAVGRLLLGAPDEQRLRASAAQLADWLGGEGAGRPLADVAHTLTRRLDGRARAAVVGRDRDALAQGLRALAAGEGAPGVVEAAAPREGAGPVWVFSGQGSQWAGMGRRLLVDEPAFAAAVDELDPLIRREAGLSLREELERGEEITGIERQQPVLFGVQVALARLWQAHGARPAAVVGHSVGEIAAAVVAGGLTPAEGARVVAQRTRLMKTVAGGAMALVELPAEELAALVADRPGADIAVFNAPGQTVVAGEAAPVAEIVAEVEARGLLAKRINSEVAGHCPMVEPVTAGLAAALADLAGATPEVPFYTTAADDPRRTPAFDAAYWVGNMRRPVRFAQAVAAAAADGHTTFVEVSPHPVLAHALAENLRAAGVRDALVVSSARRSDDETAHFHAQLAALQLAGHAEPAGAGRVADVPTTPWRHVPHWLPAPRTGRATRAGEHPLLGDHVELPGGAGHAWQGELDGRHPWLAGHATLPATAWLEMAVSAAAAALRTDAGGVVVEDLELHEQLALGERATLTTSFTPAGRHRGRITVHSRVAAGAWRLHATAAVVVGADVDAPPATAAPDDALTLRWPDELRSTSGLAVHPAMAEPALRALGAAAGDGPWLACGMGRARVPGTVRDAVAATVALGDERHGTRSGDIELLDAAGRLVLELRGVVLRRASADEQPVPLPEKLLALSWRPAEVPADRGVDGTWLVVAGESDRRAAALRDSLLARGATAQVLCPELARIALHEEAAPDGVVVLAPLAPADADADGALAAAERSVLDVAGVVRALAERGATGTGLWLVTAGAAAVTDGDRVEPGPAALRGVVRVLALEHAELRPRWVDLDPGGDLGGLLVELAGGGADDEVAWRAGRRHVARLERPGLPAASLRHRPVVRPDGAYVVTGGLGGLGLVLARWLAERGAGRIVLNGRSAPRPEAEAVLAELRATGTEVVVALGDLAAAGVADRVVAAARAGGRRLRGVLHGAAVIEDRAAVALDAEHLSRVWAAKATGGWRLHAATAGLEVDWWVGFSSAAALLGSPGQAAYAAANAYLDALTARRRADGLAASTINWGTWAEVGQAADRDVQAVRAITPAEGVEALEAVLAAGLPATGVLRLDPARLVELFPAVAGVPLYADVIDAGAAAGEDGWPGVEALADRDPAEARGLAATQLRARVASVMGVGDDWLDPSAPLTGLGVDSLLAVRIRNAVQHDFGVVLPPALLLRGASLDAVARWLADELGLPSAAAAGPVLVPPRDAAERLVAAVWAEVLGRPVGVTTEFAGDGEQALRIAALLAQRSGRELDVAGLFAHPTIERQAALVREPEPEDEDGSPLRVLRSGGTRRPLFVFHPGGGDTLVYQQLVEELCPDVPVYGFDRLDGVASVEDRVARYLPLLREVQPHGPYRLAGWSFGGFLAYEAATQLRAAGEEVEVLALIDSILPLQTPEGMGDLELLELRFARFAEFLERSYGKPVDLPYERMARLDDEAQTDVLIEEIVRAGVIDEAVSPAILRHQRTSYLDVRALERYRPERYDGPIAFYSPADLPPDGMRDPRFDRRDPARGWDAVCDGPLEVVPVSGHHLSVLDPGNVEMVARHLASELDRAG